MKYFPELSPGFAALLGRLRGRPVAVVGHMRPDGDCIGSQVALAQVLAAQGIAAQCVNADPVPRRLRFLAKGMEFLNADGAAAMPADTAAIFVDCADHSRPGERLKARFPRPIANIDHHMSTVGYAEANLVDSKAAATGEVLAGLFLDNGLEIGAQAAQALYTGILTDTGQFRFNSTSRRCLALAGELVARGARPSEAGFELYERESLGKLQLLQRFLASLRMEHGGRICIGVLPVGIFEATGTNAEDTEGLVDYARCIDGVEIGALVEERPDGGVKASLRAKDPRYRLDQVAAAFNGGGHACAAGLNMREGGKDFYQRLVAALVARIDAVGAGAR